MRDMMRILGAVCTAALAVTVLASCSNDPTVNPNGTNTNGLNLVFQQVDRVGKPGIKELYLPFGMHAGYNSASPANDPTAFGPTIASFVSGAPAGRSAAIATYVSDLLVPDALIADFSDTSGRASYLGWETSGQLRVDCTGLPPTAFGGRAIGDDVVNAMLGLAFGSSATSTTLTAPTPNVGVNAPPDDGAEKNGLNGTPNLTSDQVSCVGKSTPSQVFPYLANPV
jgi:hypothetical protein